MVDIKGILVNDTTLEGRTALMIAATRGNSFAITALLTVDGIEVNNTVPNRTTPLMEAARLGHTNAVTALLADTRVLINQVRQSDGYTALMLAIQSNHLLTANCLLKRKDIDISTVALNGQTAISLASVCDNKTIICRFK